MKQQNQMPKWQEEVEIFSTIKKALILEGNIFDRYPSPWNPSITLPNYLEKYFTQEGYTNVVLYNHVDGFSAGSEEHLNRFAALIGEEVRERKIAAPFIDNNQGAPMMIRAAMAQRKESTVVILNLASRYVHAPDRMDSHEQKSYSILLQAMLEATSAKSANGIKSNMMIFIANKTNDIPAWMYLDISQIKSIYVDYPTASQRREYIEKGGAFDKAVYDQYQADINAQGLNLEKELDKIYSRFVAKTEGFSFYELNQLLNLSRSRKTKVNDICSVIDLYNYGISDNPWDDSQLKSRLKDGLDMIRRRVKGQDEAVSQSLDILKRAVTGLSNARNSASPKGILFFAGPTGTGKTETAKTLAELVFGDESACIRFDMSEYMHDNSDQRLLGAPPGYVGYEAGGQLTNAVRNNPFRILLFDEIEKASPSIMDKFLQILEDGRMTDGQGNTVYFSDCVIVFTSNLGIYTTDQYGVRSTNVTRDMSKEEVHSKIVSAIQDHFKIKLGRPEILNRIGENIVVFDYISEDTAKAIMDARLMKIKNTIWDENGITMDFNPVMEKLYQRVLKNLDNGGRGINNIIEKCIINPVARHIFDDGIEKGQTMIVEDIIDEKNPLDIRWRCQ